MFMNVKMDQLKEHTSLNCALTEAQRLSKRLDTEIYTVTIVGVTKPEPVYPANHGKPWSREDDRTLLLRYMSGGNTPRELAPLYKRTVWAIQCRLYDLGLDKVHKDQNYRGW